MSMGIDYCHEWDPVKKISLDTYFLLYDRVSKWNHIDLIDIIYLTDLRNLF